MLFPFSEFWWFYGLFVLFVLGMLALDLGVFHRHAHEVTFKEAAAWSVVWVSLAFIFCGVFYIYSLHYFRESDVLAAFPNLTPESAAKRVSMEFIAGFLVEKSLAVDNLFVFIVIFNYFGIPALYQHRVLFWGIIGALVFRTIFIAMGAVLMQYHAVAILFGVFLIFTGLKLVFSEDKPLDPEHKWFFRILKKFFPIWPKLEGQRFWIKRDGVQYVTPLMVALVFIEFSDIIFAVDSVPAIFALTKEPLIVFTSNIFAILGLRAMFLLVARFLPNFRFLKYGLAAVLVFVGLKMVWLNSAFGGQFPIAWSLGLIALFIGGAIVASWLIPPKEEKE